MKVQNTNEDLIREAIYISQQQFTDEVLSIENEEDYNKFISRMASLRGLFSYSSINIILIDHYAHRLNINPPMS